MIKNSGALLRDLRNMKRNQTVTQKQMLSSNNSSKQLKKFRSSQQIRLNQFLDNNKNDKIKNIDERLEIHQSQIDRNNGIITELTNNFLNLKEAMIKQKEKSQNEQRRNKLLKEEIERTNKILRNKNIKIEECIKKIEILEKQNQANKLLIVKNQENLKLITSLRKTVNTLEQSLMEKKALQQQKQTQIQKLKQKIYLLNSLKNQQENIKKQIQQKQKNISKLNETIKNLQTQKMEQIGKNTILEEKIKSTQKILQTQKNKYNNLLNQSQQYRNNYQTAQKKLVLLENQQNSINIKLKTKQGFEIGLRAQIQQYKFKFEEAQTNLNNKKEEIYKKDQQLDKLNKKIKELENNKLSSSKQLQQLKAVGVKSQSLRKKTKNLEQMYKSIVPQIQCPYGHQLNNPVTIIPCGHNYCLGCKKGYTKDCMQCSGKLKIEAVYRNQLMDDIIGIVNSLKQILEMIK